MKLDASDLQILESLKNDSQTNKKWVRDLLETWPPEQRRFARTRIDKLVRAGYLRRSTVGASVFVTLTKAGREAGRP